MTPASPKTATPPQMNGEGVVAWLREWQLALPLALAFAALFLAPTANTQVALAEASAPRGAAAALMRQARPNSPRPSSA